ncbi:MAG: N-acetyltransferase family protein [Rhodospirillales bacterium]
MNPIRILAAGELGLYRQHLLRLSPADRRLRFGYAIEDTSVDAHLSGLSRPHDRILACFGDDLSIIGAVHIAFCGNKAAEFAFSVEACQRDRGIGTALFARAIIFARNRGVGSIHIHCLAVNREMRRLARHAGMEIVTADGESEGSLTLPRASLFTFATEMLSERAGLRDCRTKANRRTADLWHGGLRPPA